VKTHSADSSSGEIVPWRDGPTAYIDGLRKDLGVDGVVLGVIDPRKPQPDALLAVQGAKSAEVSAWCDKGHKADASFREARKKGVAVCKTGKTTAGPALPASRHAAVYVQPAVAGQRRAWYLAVSRKAKAFSDTEIRRGELALKLIQSQFDHAGESDLGRLMLGDDNRLIHADPRSEALFLKSPKVLDDLAEQLPLVAEQRWDDLEDHVQHEMTLSLAGKASWVRFHRGRAGRGSDRRHLYVELRPSKKDDLPAVGLVEDDRTAAAMGYLSDHFVDTPGLTELSEYVETSPFHFHRLFSRHAKISPKHYLLRTQLQHAKWLLRASREQIGEVSILSGFASHGHFTATFHRMVGVSPSQYREKY
jgi:AraC family transcriptional regulator